MASETKKVFEAKDIAENKTLAATSYLWILCLLPLLFHRNSEFVKAHSKQGLILFIVDLIVGGLFFWVPFLLLVLVIISLVAFYKTFQGEYWAIPGISWIMKKIKL